MSKDALFHSLSDQDSMKSRDDNAVSCNECTDSSADSESRGWELGEKREADPDTLARFWAKVNRRGTVPIHRPELGECWEWTVNLVRGYGQLVLPRTDDGRQPHLYAHRFAFELTFGRLPSEDIKVCHKCDNRRCVRPSHLFPGSQADNLNDARRKGRLIDGLGARKLSDAAYRDILTRPFIKGSGQALAAKYGVSEVTICRIRNGKQGSTYHRAQRPVFERVPFREVPVVGTIHAGQSVTVEFNPQRNTVAARFA